MIRLPLVIQSLVPSLALLGTGAWWYLSSQHDVHVASAVAQARAVVTQLQTTMDWIAEAKGIWELEEPGKPYNSKTQDVAVYPAASPAGIPRDSNLWHQKSPSTVINHLAMTMTKNGQVEGAQLLTPRSLTTSTPEPQREALAAITAAPKSEYIRIVGNTAVYARALQVGSACLNCHDSPNRAPTAMSVKYRHDPTIFGYTPGGFVGALAIAMPIKADAVSVSHGSRIPVVAFGAVLVSTILWFFIGIVVPAKQLAHFSKQVVASDPSSPSDEYHLVADVHESRNEFHGINDALNALLRSQSLAGQTSAVSPGSTSEKLIKPSRSESTLGSTDLGFDIH